MRYKIITALIGASMVMTALSGCGSKKDNQETELQSLVISDMELVAESEAETESEKKADLSTEAMEIDLDEDGGSASKMEGAENEIVEEEETELQSETVPASVKNVGKPGEDEPESEKETKKTKKETEKTKKETEKVAQKKQKETAKEVLEAGAKEVQSEPESESPAEAETQLEPESESPAEAETQLEPESESPAEAETQLEPESESPAEAETKKTAEGIRIVNDRVNVRKGPSVEEEALALLTSGMKVLALGSDGEWTEIRYEAEDGSFADGFVKSEYLSGLEVLFVVSEKINVRAEASTESAKLGELQAEDTVMVEEQMANGWSRIKYTVGNETKDAYVKTEFLKAADRSALKARIVEEADRLAEEDGIAAASETEAETQAESGSVTEAETQAESGSVEEAETQAESESVEEAETQAESESVEEAETQAESESVTEAETQAESESVEEAETQAESESVTEAETQAESGSGTEAVTLADGEEGQFELAGLLCPEAKKIGIIYSQGNDNAKVQIGKYEELAESYGMEIIASEIAEAADIDLAASELVGDADCIFCIDDPEVNELVQTVCAYADEVEIPVVGVLPSQVEMGCVAAYEGGVLHWNVAEADKLGLGEKAGQFGNIEEY